MDPREDSLLVYPVCETCFRGKEWVGQDQGGRKPRVVVV